MKILIVDDSEKWIMHHESMVKNILKNSVQIDTALSAEQGVQKIIATVNEPYDIIFTDMQMESDYLPLYAGEWFIQQIKFLKEYNNTKIVIISATSDIKSIAEKYGTDYIPKYRCNKSEVYCKELLKNS